MQNEKGNKDLHTAKSNAADEFYTAYDDVAKEMTQYGSYFRDKHIYCPCDNGEVSNFYRYFKDNFEHFGLSRLTATALQKPEDNSGGLYYNIYKDFDEERCYLTESDGDFRSKAIMQLINHADIIATNPPFSLFREFISILIKSNKDFIILGNINAVTYKEVFPMFLHGKLWYGASIHSHGRDFRVPDDYPLQAYEFRTDAQGRKYINVKGVRWFTNVDYKERHEKMILYKHYTPEQYPKYENYNVIEVSKSADIPADYPGVMGVPISFIDKYTPEQFEIIGMAEDNGKGFSGKAAEWDGKNPHCVVDGKNKFKRIFIRNRFPQKAGAV